MRDKTKYNAYINSPDWQEKRKEVFEAKGYKCEACGISEGLQVHHGTYRRLYKEKIKDLFVLCGYCHMSLHDKYGTRDLLRATKAFIRGEELIPRKNKSKARGKKRKVKSLSGVILYGEFRIRKLITFTRFQMIMAKNFNEKKYKRFLQRYNNGKKEITTVIIIDA